MCVRVYAYTNTHEQVVTHGVTFSAGGDNTTASYMAGKPVKPVPNPFLKENAEFMFHENGVCHTTPLHIRVYTY